MSEELKLYWDGTETYVARSVEHARTMQLRDYGDNPEPLDAWEERTEPDPLTVRLDDDRGKVTQPIAAWIAATLAEHPEGFVLCSSEW